MIPEQNIDLNDGDWEIDAYPGNPPIVVYHYNLRRKLLIYTVATREELKFLYTHSHTKEHDIPFPHKKLIIDFSKRKKELLAFLDEKRIYNAHNFYDDCEKYIGYFDNDTNRINDIKPLIDKELIAEFRIGRTVTAYQFFNEENTLKRLATAFDE